MDLWTNDLVNQSPVVTLGFFSADGWSSRSVTLIGWWRTGCNEGDGLWWFGDRCWTTVVCKRWVDTFGDVESRGGVTGSLLIFPLSVVWIVL